VAPLASRFVCCSLDFPSLAADPACKTFKINALIIFLFHFSLSNNDFAASRNNNTAKDCRFLSSSIHGHQQSIGFDAKGILKKGKNGLLTNVSHPLFVK
jgi:hypothetical protein